MFLDGSERVRKESVDHYIDVLVAIIANFPRRTPRVKTLRAALAQFFAAVGVKYSKDWVKKEAKNVRAMLSYVRRCKKKYGVASRPSIHSHHVQCPLHYVESCVCGGGACAWKPGNCAEYASGQNPWPSSRPSWNQTVITITRL